MNDMTAIPTLVDRELHAIVRSRKVHGDAMRKVAQFLWFLAWCGSGLVWLLAVVWSVTDQVALPAVLATTLLVIVGFLMNRFSPKLTPAEQKEWAARPVESYLNSSAWNTNPGNPASANYQSLHSLHDRFSRH